MSWRDFQSEFAVKELRRTTFFEATGVKEVVSGGSKIAVAFKTPRYQQHGASDGAWRSDINQCEAVAHRQVEKKTTTRNGEDLAESISR